MFNARRLWTHTCEWDPPSFRTHRPSRMIPFIAMIIDRSTIVILSPTPEGTWSTTCMVSCHAGSAIANDTGAALWPSDLRPPLSCSLHQPASSSIPKAQSLNLKPSPVAPSNYACSSWHAAPVPMSSRLPPLFQSPARPVALSTHACSRWARRPSAGVLRPTIICGST